MKTAKPQAPRYEPESLDRMYNNRALVPDYATYLDRWQGGSADAREALRCDLDVAYGAGPQETLDVFPAREPGAPVLVFIHGGYWRALDKSDHSFVASLFVHEGACVVVPNYALCPAVTVPQIALQMAHALAWTWRNIARYGGDPDRIHVAGHSAGGHLAAMVQACRWKQLATDLPKSLVRSSMGISGLYDLAPLMHTPFLQQDLRLDEDQVRRASPALFPPPPQGRFHAVVGGDESPEFLRQNRLIRQAWGAQRVPVCESVPGRHHFSVLEAFTEPGHALHERALAMLELG